MGRIKDCFENLKAGNKKALIPFITAGDPSPDITLPLLNTLVENGADIIELGVPFSDPMADGPVIQRSTERALKHKIGLHNVLDMVREFRKTDQKTPLILMGYLNPVEIMGYDRFANEANEAGVDGVLLVDMPPEESDALQAELKKYGIDQVFLLSPTTSDKRLDVVCAKASGFLYYVSLKGVTGSNQLSISDVSEKIGHIRRKTELPIGVGFGIKDAESAKSVSAFSDAVIVGSSLVSLIADLTDKKDEMLVEAGKFISGLRTALNVT